VRYFNDNTPGSIKMGPTNLYKRAMMALGRSPETLSHGFSSKNNDPRP